jgi:hypothetical protein
VIHWNGQAWSPVDHPTTAALYALWGSCSSDVWAVGGEWNMAPATILHWDGEDWTSQTFDPPDMLGGVWGSGPEDIWAAGQKGTLLHYH